MSPFALLRAAAILGTLSTTVASAAPALRFSGKHGEPVTIQQYKHSLPSTQPLGVDLLFEPADAKKLWRLMRANVGSKVSLHIGSTDVLTPVVRDVPVGTGLQLTLDDAETFETVKKALEGEL